MNANQNLPPELFDFYSDPACGWIHVPWTTFAQYYIDPSMFSNLSHADAFGAYLEEDYDLPRFIEISSPPPQSASSSTMFVISRAVA